MTRERSITTPPPVAPARLHEGRPVLEPEPSHAWESRVVLNAAAILLTENFPPEWRLRTEESEMLKRAGGACVMVFRAQGEAGSDGHAASSLGLALLTPDLKLVKRWSEPVIRPDADFHRMGVEDPRCTLVDDLYYLYYTGFSRRQGEPHVQVCLATTRNFIDWTLHGPADGDLNEFANKNAALLPHTVNGLWVLLHRPMEGPGAMAIHWAVSESPVGPWTSRGVLMESYTYREFARSWIGAGGPPVWIGENRFLMIYHQGHFTSEGRREYDLAAALLDFDRDEPVLSRIEPLMRPTGDAERKGDAQLGVDNVLFTCANYEVGNQLVIPYAGSDSRIFGASISIPSLLEALEKTARP